jgi:hypothetical protein
MKLSPNEQEAANRAEATALLIRSGFRAYLPEANVQGEDLVVRDPGSLLRSVPLKSRPCVDWSRYGGPRNRYSITCPSLSLAAAPRFLSL